MDQTQEDLALERAEQFESIPWSQLVPDTAAKNKRILIIGATVVAGVVIGLVGGRIIRGATQPGVVATLPPIAAPEVAVAPALDETPSVQVVIPTTLATIPLGQTPLPPQLYSEADLMAVLPEEEMRAAVMRAEWFVTDYFTIDGESSAAADVVAALPDGYGAVPLPHQSAQAGISYVEWARAYRVEPLEPARYRVAVAFRTLSGPAVGNLTRSSVRAVAVDVEVGPDGATGVLDFPSPLEPPGTLALEASTPPDMDAPAEVLTGALQTATLVGSDPAPLLTGLDNAGWRVVVLVGDESGLRWPMSIRP
jgi:hypothetical protein